MNTRIGREAALLLFLLLTACSMLPQAGGTHVWIDAPVNETIIAELRPIQIEGHASSPDGINRVEIMVNGELITTLNNPPIEGGLASYQTTWTPPEPGDYFVQAIAFGANGASSEPDTTHIRFSEKPGSETTELVAIPPTDTTTPEATLTLTATEEPTLPIDTPTPTNTAQPEPVIHFWADPATIQAGGCTDLRWHVENVQRVVFGGVNQPFDGSDNECMCKNQIYPLTITHLDGQEEKRTVEVNVTGECATPIPPDTLPPPAPSPAVPADNLSLSCRASQNLVWLPVNDPSGIAEYQVEVQRSSDNANWQNTPGSPLTGISNKSADLGVECGWYYRWRVRAVDGKGNVGPWSGWSRFSIPLG